MRQEPRRFDLRSHVGQFELNRLKLGDRASELSPLLRVMQSCFISALSHSDRQRGDADTAAVEYLESINETITKFAQQVLLRHTAIFEYHRRCVAGPQPKFVFFLPGEESG